MSHRSQVTKFIAAKIIKFIFHSTKYFLELKLYTLYNITKITRVDFPFIIHIICWLCLKQASVLPDNTLDAVDVTVYTDAGYASTAFFETDYMPEFIQTCYGSNEFKLSATDLHTSTPVSTPVRAPISAQVSPTKLHNIV